MSNNPFLIAVDLFVASKNGHIIDNKEHKCCTVEKLSFPDHYTYDYC